MKRNILLCYEAPQGGESADTSSQTQVNQTSPDTLTLETTIKTTVKGAPAVIGLLNSALTADKLAAH